MTPFSFRQTLFVFQDALSRVWSGTEASHHSGAGDGAWSATCSTIPEVDRREPLLRALAYAGESAGYKGRKPPNRRRESEGVTRRRKGSGRNWEGVEDGEVL
jgi:hypothetical protein